MTCAPIRAQFFNGCWNNTSARQVVKRLFGTQERFPYYTMPTSSTQTLTADEIKRTVHALIARPERRFRTIDDVAAHCGVGRKTLFRFMSQGLPVGDGARLKALRLRLIKLAAETGAVTV